MASLTRALRITVPMAGILLGATLAVNASAHTGSCAHPSALMSIMQKVGLAHLQPCEVIELPTENGEICAAIGHHCNDGTGPGKCRTVVDSATSRFSCQCDTAH